jgi:hypothetical protein
VGVLAACDRSRDAVRVDSTGAAAAPTPAVPVPEAPVVSGWRGEAGPALFVVGERTGEALVVVPAAPGGSTDSVPEQDSVPGAARAILPAEVELFSRAGSVARVRLSTLPSDPADDACTSWPHARIDRADDTPAWTVGFAGTGVAALPLDSIEALTSADSAQLAAEMTRLASALPGDTAASFRALPYSVRSARRFTPAPGIAAIVATIVRSVNQEAKPLGEHILLVAERSAAGGRYVAAYHERRSGREETVETVEPLAAVLLGADRRPSLVISRDYYEGTAYSLLERVGPGRWRVRWTSAYVGC